MKSALFFFLCAAAVAAAQTDTFRKPATTDSIYQYANGQIERIDTYNARGLYISSKYFKEDGSPSEIVQAEYVGGREALNRYLIDNIRYPAAASKKDRTGKVFVRFWIDEQGKAVNSEVLLSPHEALSEEALRLVNAMPAWTPGTRDGKPHKCLFTMPVSFAIK
jgi:TonB family protein